MGLERMQIVLQVKTKGMGSGRRCVCIRIRSSWRRLRRVGILN